MRTAGRLAWCGDCIWVTQPTPCTRRRSIMSCSGHTARSLYELHTLLERATCFSNGIYMRLSWYETWVQNDCIFISTCYSSRPSQWVLFESSTYTQWIWHPIVLIDEAKSYSPEQNWAAQIAYLLPASFTCMWLTTHCLECGLRRRRIAGTLSYTRCTPFRTSLWTCARILVLSVIRSVLRELLDKCRSAF